ncbi:MAG: TonB-dependent siderophore receptor [Gammaproteobacteria bacterium]|nr:TonB-dependent siderophore receptor [Pseudomonadales bacterium]MCP5348996.1 TonB-dependent siderophore receptor [Pseudomonadales bacterium]
MEDQSAGNPQRQSALFLAVASTLAAGLAAAPFGAQAQSDTEAPVIEVSGQRYDRDPDSLRFTRPLLDTAQTVNIISEDLIDARAATTLRDVLRNVSGISMQAGEGGTPAGDQLSIRGFSARTDIFVDNVRDFGGYTRDPFNLEQVEVVKGPSSDYSGRGSTGGSINLVSKAPGLEQYTDTSLTVGGDSFTRATVDLNRPLANLDDSAFRLNVLYHSQDIPGRDLVSNERSGIAPSMGFGLGTETELVFSLFHLQQDNVPDYGIPWVPADNVPLAAYANQAPPVDYSNWYGLKARDFEELRTSLATLEVKRILSDRLVLQNITRWGLTDRDSMITAPRFIGNDSTAIRRSDEKYRDQEDDIISNQTNVNLTLNEGSDWEHRILLGAEFNLEGEKRLTQVLTGEDSPSTDLFDPTPYDPYLENYLRTGTASTADSRSLAFYLSDSLQINEQWQINGGLRWDHFHLEYTPDGSPLLERTDRMLSYRAGIVYKPVSAGSVYLGYGTSFNPTAEALSISTSSRQPGIADLDPEENQTLELGTKWEVFNRNLFLNAALFRTEKTNARTQDPDDPTDLLVLQGEQLVEGVELGVAGRLGEKLNLNAGYTFLHTEVTDSRDATEIGNELDNSPRHSFNVWGTYDLSERFQVGLGALFVDKRFNSTANARQAPDYWVYEASASYLVSDNLSFRFNVQNLTDERYIDFVGGGHFIPGTGRLALLSSTFSF